jgi:hypothetical protein
MACGTCPSFEHTLGLWQPSTPRFAYGLVALGAAVARSSLVMPACRALPPYHRRLALAFKKVYVTAEEPTRSCAKATANYRPMPQSRDPAFCRSTLYGHAAGCNTKSCGPSNCRCSHRPRAKNVGKRRRRNLLSDLKNLWVQSAPGVAKTLTIALTITLSGLRDRCRRSRDPVWR